MGFIRIWLKRRGRRLVGSCKGVLAKGTQPNPGGAGAVRWQKLVEMTGELI